MTTTNYFGNIIANDLTEIKMYAGDQQSMTYTIYNSSGGLYDLNSATCTVRVFKLGDPTNLTLTLTGAVSGSPSLGQFTTTFPSASSVDLSGVYLQQPVVVDSEGNTHIPSQGKIIIFPSPTS